MSENNPHEAARNAHASVGPPTRNSGLVEFLEGLERAAPPWGEGSRRALAQVLTDASLASDETTLRYVLKWLQWVISRDSGDDAAQAMSGQSADLAAFISIAQYGLGRAQAVALASTVDLRGIQGQFLEKVAENPGCSNSELVTLLESDETQVSRAGAQLAKRGLATKRKVGRHNYWEITPRGRGILRENAGEPDVHGRVYGSTLALEQLRRTPTPGEVAELANVSFAQASAAASSLVGQGLLSRDEMRPDVVHINEQPVCAIGVSIRPDGITGLATDVRARNILGPKHKRLANQAVETVVHQIADLVDELRSDMNAAGTPRHIIGLGVELAGQVDVAKGEVVFSPDLHDSPGVNWRGVTLSAELQQRTGLPTVVENDANALAAHEQWFGDGAGVEDLMVVLIGDRGVGSGIISGGQLLHGARGVSGEIGHMMVSTLQRKCRCGNYGCLETVVSSLGIRESFHLESPPFDLVPVALAVEKGERSAITAIERAGEALGRGISFVSNVVRPALVVVFGPRELTQPDEGVLSASIFLQEMEKAANTGSFPRDSATLKITLHTVDPSLGARGAASALLQHLITPRKSISLTQVAIQTDPIAAFANVALEDPVAGH